MGSRAGNEYAKATDDAALKADDLFQKATSTWSESRLKAYLDARGVPVPQSGKKDELLAAVRLNRHKAATGWSAWTFDTWTTENLKKYLASSGNKAAEKASKQADASREQLLSAAQVAYARNSRNYFQYGTTTPQGTLWAKLSNTFEYIKTQLSFGAASGRKYAEEQAEVAADRIKEGSTYATNRAGEA